MTEYGDDGVWLHRTGYPRKLYFEVELQYVLSKG